MDIFFPQSAEDLKDILQTHASVVFDFYSTDCPPCAKLEPIFERAAAHYPDVAFVKMHRQDHRDIAESYHIFSSPTVLFFSQGTLQQNRLAGVIEEVELHSEIERLILLGKNS